MIEYTLLLAFVALASAAIFIGAGNSISGIWGATNTRLANIKPGDPLTLTVAPRPTTVSA